MVYSGVESPSTRYIHQIYDSLGMNTCQWIPYYLISLDLKRDHPSDLRAGFKGCWGYAVHSTLNTSAIVEFLFISSPPLSPLFLC